MTSVSSGSHTRAGGCPACGPIAGQSRWVPSRSTCKVAGSHILGLGASLGARLVEARLCIPQAERENFEPHLPVGLVKQSHVTFLSLILRSKTFLPEK